MLHLKIGFAFARSMAFYAVARGHKVGIYESWTACEKQVKGFKSAKFKKFNTRFEAEEFIKENGGENAKEFLRTLAPIEVPTNMNVIQEEKSTSQNDYWPESDGDTLEEYSITDEDLLNAIYEVEGLPEDKPTSTQTKKRKAIFETPNNSKLAKHSSKVLEISGYVNVGQYEFPIDDEGFVITYTDGSCINNGKPNAIAGFGVYFGQNHPLNASKPVIGRVTNNVGEIQAANYALQIARDLGIRRLCICTDSQFLINAATMWISAWKRKNWHLKDGDPVKNVADFKVLDLLLEDKQVTVKWNYVKGHANIEGNEMADKLARDGAAEYARLHLNGSKT